MMSVAPEPVQLPVVSARRPWSKRWRVPLAFLVMTAAAMAWWYWQQSMEENRLRAIYALWNQHGRWRWNDWLDDRPVVPDEENGARIIDQMIRLLPRNLETELSMYLLNEIYYSPNHVLHEEQVLELRDRIKKSSAAMKLLPDYLKRKLVVWDIPPNKTPMSILMPSIQHSRELHNRLKDLMEVELQEGKTAQAQQSIVTSIQLHHAMDDQLVLIGRLVQIGLLSMDCQYVQRWLALSEPDDQLLAALQAALATCDEQRSWRKTLFIEAGALDQTILDVRNNRLNLANLLTLGGGGTTWWERSFESVISMIQSQRLTRPNQQAECLEIYLKLYQQSQASWYVQRKGWEEMVASLKQSRTKAYLPSLKHLLLPAIDKVGEAEMKLAAKLRATQAALAAERFRRVHQRWPRSQEELLVRFLPAIQLDPYGDQPMRIKPVEDGLIIYSIGRDAIDNGGDIVETRERSIKDVGIKLWNVNQRRLAALPLPKEYLEKKTEQQRRLGGEE